MNRTTPLMLAAALALALGAVSMPACAANMGVRSLQADSASTPARYFVSQVRKVYFFRQLDTNQNGQLSRAELPMDLSTLRLNFMRVDLDGNGQLSPQEYLMYARGIAPEYIGVTHAYVFVYGVNGNRQNNLDLP